MVESMYSNREFLNLLDLYSFDFDNYVPVFVVFHEKKNNGYTNRNKKYFYKMHKNLEPKENDWVVCSVYDENRFQVGKITNIGSNIFYEAVPEIATMFEGSYPSDYIENCRPVVARINNEDMQNYYKENLSRKVRSKLEKELEGMFDFQELLGFLITGSFSDKVSSLISKIEKVDKGEYL